jgi:hypothetical protein
MFPDPIAARQNFINKGRALAGALSTRDFQSAFLDKSAIRPGSETQAGEACLFLDNLYGRDEQLFIGHTHGGASNVRSVGEWLSVFKEGQSVPFPMLIINPLTGEIGLTKNGKESLRADSCVASYRYLLGEFDGLPIEDQMAFWAGFPAPISAVTFSGGKSVHALIRVDCADRAAWETDVEQMLFGKILKPMGIDPLCKNEARLSRLPGHFRVDKGQMQKLLYLNPNPPTKGIFS